MTFLEHRIPPPVIFALVALLMWWGAREATPVDLNPALRIALIVAFAAVAVVTPLGLREFARAKTTFNPIKIDDASNLVTGGVFRYTRNPMYVGMASLLLAWAVYLAVPWTLLGPVAFVAFITRFQIIPEERVMRAKFGAVYDDYARRVRRWV
ncbi:MAG: isoprenylcysteine carboxylmethyltransferase family protein [Rhodospirillaceae bacterium]|nr:isoprenylcysteine carboxylmethyltransferase family protein [Rhodospirillaceae bacterium]